jgi:DnaK suppressor protein
LIALKRGAGAAPQDGLDGRPATETTMSAPLTPGQRAWLRAELEQRRMALERQLAEHGRGMSRVELARERAEHDLDDAPQREGERAFDIAMLDRESAELREVNQALARLTEERFGRCDECGAAIPFDRLKIEPWALRCVRCESAFEAKAARR